MGRYRQSYASPVTAKTLPADRAAYRDAKDIKPLN